MASRYTTLNRRGKRLREPTDGPEKEEGRERRTPPPSRALARRPQAHMRPGGGGRGIQFTPEPHACPDTHELIPWGHLARFLILQKQGDKGV